MAEFRGQVAVITGAGSGIGRALARELIDTGNHVVLADIDEPRLNEVHAELSNSGPRVTALVTDVSKRQAVEQLREHTLDEHGRVDIVINNAGVGLSNTIAESSYEDLEWIMGINFWGVVHGTKTFLPDLIDQNSGHIVNISSILGLVGAPTQGAYCATKFAVRGFTESLRWEVRGTRVKAHCVHPGGIRTNIARNGRLYQDLFGSRDPQTMVDDFERRMVFRTPEQAAQKILRSVRRGKERILVGPDASLYEQVQRLLPEHYGTLMLPLVEYLHRRSQPASTSR